MMGMMQPRTPAIFSLSVSHMFGCAPAQRHNVGRTLHFHLSCLNNSAGRLVEDVIEAVVAALESSGVAVAVTPTGFVDLYQLIVCHIADREAYLAQL